MENLKMTNEDKNYFSYCREEMMEFIPDTATKILEVGCASGSFGELIKQKNNAEVWGIEYNYDIAKKAEKKLDKVMVGDINNLINEIPDDYFDCIVFNDVLEHLADPALVLKKIKSKLSQKGNIVASIPNVRYIGVLKGLILKKDWKYMDFGVLDKTHLRFFTQKSIERLFKEAGYKILKIKGINNSKSFKFNIFNFFTLGFFSDIKFLQYGCLVEKE